MHVACSIVQHRHKKRSAVASEMNVVQNAIGSLCGPLRSAVAQRDGGSTAGSMRVARDGEDGPGGSVASISSKKGFFAASELRSDACLMERMALRSLSMRGRRRILTTTRRGRRAAVLEVEGTSCHRWTDVGDSRTRVNILALWIRACDSQEELHGG